MPLPGSIRHMDLPFIIQQGLVFLGILATVVLAVLATTGPRRRIENIKLAAEAASATENAEIRDRIDRFIERESVALARALDRAELRRTIAVLASLLGAFALALLAIQWALESARSGQAVGGVIDPADLLLAAVGALVVLAVIVGIMAFRQHR